MEKFFSSLKWPAVLLVSIVLLSNIFVAEDQNFLVMALLVIWFFMLGLLTSIIGVSGGLLMNASWVAIDVASLVLVWTWFPGNPDLDNLIGVGWGLGFISPLLVEIVKFFNDWLNQEPKEKPTSPNKEDEE